MNAHTHPLYELTVQALESDLKQMLECGHDEQSLRAELEAARARQSLDALAALQDEWWNRPSPPSFPYDEPDEWDAIAAQLPDPDSHARLEHGDDALADRLLAAWRGRCSGCQLGKPIEGTTWPEKIRQVLEIVGSWPLYDYMNPVPAGLTPAELPDCDFFQRGMEWRNRECRGNFNRVAPDDDIHYTLTSLSTLEQFGPAFTTEQAMDTIARVTPLASLWAAGRNMFRTRVFGMHAPHTALFGNPCRQSLGGQIRCDAFGWGAPANPALAARMAYTDARGSQVRNGIYSGMFFAALMADVLAHGDLRRALDTATAYVPPRSRFAEMIRLVRGWCDTHSGWEDVNAEIINRWPGESKQFNHSIPNAAIVITSLLKGGGKFTETLGISVMCGLDTDCNGATAGSIMGCALGTKGVPHHWYEPFNDTIGTSLLGMHTLTITDVARRTLEVARKNARTGETK
ncbi:ADP-ribosylglycohydrolase family protein [bacterium]|nr:ADP-ribosylglycohydrolase family protein [bacterium]